MSGNQNRDFSKYDAMSTEELEEILRLDAEIPEGEESDIELILYVMEVLANRKRNSDNPGKTAQQAFESFKQNYLPESSEVKSAPKVRTLGWMLKIASVAAIVCVLFAVIPQQAEADGFLGRLMRWSDSIFELFSSGTVNDNRTEYVFETDNPGLQQVYDTVAEMGVTDPVVPMWLPEGYTLMEIKRESTPRKEGIIAKFENGDASIVFGFDVYKTNSSSEYHKDETDVSTYEKSGVTHNILQNKDVCVALWTVDNIECFITAGCQEDTLRRILDSIYVMEEK